MSKYEKYIRTGNDPILKQVCADVLPGDDVLFTELMEKVCRKLKNAVGLAAPQIGVAKRAIFILAKDKNGSVRGLLMFNPVIFIASRSMTIANEGCLSYPGVYKNISRHDRIDVRYQRSPSTRPVEEIFYGYRARIIQHEVDHLDGLCKVGDPTYPDDRAVEDKFTEMNRSGTLAMK